MKLMQQNAVPFHNLLFPCILGVCIVILRVETLWADKTVRKVLSCATFFSRLLKGVYCLPPSQSISL